MSLKHLHGTIVSGQDALKRLALALDVLQATAKEKYEACPKTPPSTAGQNILRVAGKSWATGVYPNRSIGSERSLGETAT